MRLQDFAKFRDATIIQPQRAKLLVPTMSLAASPWAGASVILAEFDISNGYYFSFYLPIAEFGSDFIPAIRWVEDEVVHRYKLWDDENAVLYYPVYNGERIGLNATIEIWSLNSTGEPTLLTAKILPISVLAFPVDCPSCCTNEDVTQTLVQAAARIIDTYAYCSPFCAPLIYTP